MSRLQALQEKISYTFSDTGLLRQALTHRSTPGANLERMEFLGDAVLSLVISEALYAMQPDADEGGLTRQRAKLVRREGLLTIAGRWGLASHVNVGKGERGPDGSIKSESILADAVEAVIGAVFLDGGWAAARALVLSGWASELARDHVLDMRDAKTQLQEIAQARGWGLPEYRITDHGLSSSPRFEAACRVQGRIAGTGSGGRKKTAEMQAAERALDTVDPEGHALP